MVEARASCTAMLQVAAGTKRRRCEAGKGTEGVSLLLSCGLPAELHGSESAGQEFEAGTFSIRPGAPTLRSQRTG